MALPAHDAVEAALSRLRILSLGATVAAAACAGSTAATSADATTASDANSTTTSSTTVAAVTCANNLPTACPTPAPSYATDVQPIINNICQECHAPGGIGASVGNGGFGGGGGGPGATTTAGTTTAGATTAGGTTTGGATTGTTTRYPSSSFDPSTAHDWSVYENIVHNRTTMLQDVFLCRMPPANVTPLSDADRTTLMTWLVCGAPQN